MSTESSSDPIRIGISTCLLGEEVRFDGGHKRDAWATERLAQFVEFVPVCPEVEIGLGIPRETIRLERLPEGIRLIASKTRRDLTHDMDTWARRRARELEDRDLCGYILKKGSPSCGMERVKIWDRNGSPSKDGRGLFAAALMERHPLLPIEEEGRLNDPRLRENFIERVFAFRRLKDLFAGRVSMGRLVAFHTAEKLLVLAHDPTTYRELGRLVADGKGTPPAELKERYQTLFMSALRKLATARKHRNVLEHAAGHLKKVLATDEKAELHGHIADFAAGLVPLIVPITLLSHHVRKHGIEYLAGQTYLAPHPKELMLRNHV